MQTSFQLFGVQPLLGRGFLPEEDRPGGNKVAVLSYSLWQSRYGGDRGIINREILLNGEKHTVVGVMPAGFQFLENDVRLWVPLALDPGRAGESRRTLLAGDRASEARRRFVAGTGRHGRSNATDCCRPSRRDF